MRTQQPQSALQFFGFPYPPFADTFEVREPFQSEAESRILQRSLTLLRQGRSFAVHGDAGTGKSMLIKTILNALDPKDYRIAHIPYGGIKQSAVLRELCDELDIDTTGRKNLLSRLARDFTRSADKPFPIIIIDDAHVMPNESFLDICSLLHDAKSRTAAAVVIFAGQPALKNTLELDVFKPVRTRLTCMFSMPRLSDDEAKRFIAYRLTIAKADEKIFDPEALEFLAADSKGNRRVLMSLAAMCLEEAAMRKDKVITPEIVNAVTTEYCF
jgi:type II secretory pathway predicted ATPase ExeA